MQLAKGSVLSTLHLHRARSVRSSLARWKVDACRSDSGGKILLRGFQLIHVMRRTLCRVMGCSAKSNKGRIYAI